MFIPDFPLPFAIDLAISKSVNIVSLTSVYSASSLMPVVFSAFAKEIPKKEIYDPAKDVRHF